MANIQRRSKRPNVVGEIEHSRTLSTRFPSKRLVDEYDDLLLAAREKGDLRAWRETLKQIEDRIHGRPAQVIQHENTSVSDIVGMLKERAEEMGFLDAIEVEGVVVGEETGSNEPGVSTHLLVGGQLHTDARTEGIP